MRSDASKHTTTYEAGISGVLWVYVAVGLLTLAAAVEVLGRVGIIRRHPRKQVDVNIAVSYLVLLAAVAVILLLLAQTG